MITCPLSNNFCISPELIIVSISVCIWLIFFCVPITNTLSTAARRVNLISTCPNIFPLEVPLPEPSMMIIFQPACCGIGIACLAACYHGLTSLLPPSWDYLYFSYYVNFPVSWVPDPPFFVYYSSLVWIRPSISFLRRGECKVYVLTTYCSE